MSWPSAGLHPPGPPAKRLYRKVAHPPRDSRGTRSSQSVPEPHSPSSSSSGIGRWSVEQLQRVAANSSSVSGSASATLASRWRHKSPTKGQGFKPRDRQPQASRTPPGKRAPSVTIGSTSRCGPGPRGPVHGTTSKDSSGALNDGHRLNKRAPPLYAGNQSRPAPSSSSSAPSGLPGRAPPSPSSSRRQPPPQSYADTTRGPTPSLVRTAGEVEFRVTFARDPQFSHHSRGAFRHPTAAGASALSPSLSLSLSRRPMPTAAERGLGKGTGANPTDERPEPRCRAETATGLPEERGLRPV